MAAQKERCLKEESLIVTLLVPYCVAINMTFKGTTAITFSPPCPPQHALAPLPLQNWLL